MKFTLTWLKDHLDLDAPLETIVDAMIMAGLEVEEVADPARELAAFTTAKVLKAEPHPDADRLRVCEVETKDGLKQIVCGAPNARAGMTAIYAPLGTHIPGLGLKLDDEPRKIRGVESQGMMCSAKEIGAGEEHDGILDLPGDWPVGAPAAEAMGLGEAVIDFEVTPNRPDWLGVHGVARDLAAAGLGKFKDAPVKPVEGKFPCPVNIIIEAPAACPVFAGRLVRGIKNGPSPEWLQARLRAVGLRPINALVDITNYISFDRCRPLHVYDAAKLKGDVIARLGRQGEELAALDDKTYAIDDDMCVIADDSGAIGLGGVMGGASTGCDETTTEVFIESAFFDPKRTMRTGRRTGIISDARYRFERGVDTGFVVGGLELATQMVLELCGGEPSDVYVAGAAPKNPPAFEFDPARVGELTGLALSDARIEELLKALGCSVRKQAGGDLWKVTPPSWRRDLEGPADLVEEVARLEGFDKLPATPLPKPPGRAKPALTEGQQRMRAARTCLAARGVSEAVTWSFCAAEHAALFGWDAEAQAGLKVANPISADLSVMRPTPLTHLVLAAQRAHDRSLPGPQLFEVGPAYRSDAPTGQDRVAAVLRSPAAPRFWRPGEAMDAYLLKADALAVLEAAGAPIGSLKTFTDVPAWLHPGRAGSLRLGPKNTLAVFGELHPRVLKAIDVDGPLYVAEIYLDAIPAPKAKATKTRPALALSEFMPVRRDLAFLVDKTADAEALVTALMGADKKMIAAVRLFDVFEGGGLPEDKRSLALELTLQPQDKTLKDDEIEAVIAKAVAAAEKSVGAVLRR